MEGLSAAVLLLVVGAAGAAAVYVQQKLRGQRYAQLGTLACSVCDQEGVEERGSGSYRCSACGYDTDAALPPDRAALVREIQELAIAAACMDAARREFEQSKHHTRTTTQNGQQRREDVGPFHDRYLEGIEQAEEASAILRRLVDHLPAVGPALACIGAIEPPTDGREGFNPRADAAAREAWQAQQILIAVRRTRSAAFRGGAP